MVTVGHSCEVHLLINGLVDTHKEIERLNGLIGEKQSGQRKLLENTQAGDYEKVYHSPMSMIAGYTFKWMYNNNSILFLKMGAMS